MDPVLFTSESDEHYTPPELLEMVVEVMGHIDLDPCADPQKRVPAKRHYTKEDNGLALPWKGQVFMNPPYGNATKEWVRRLDTKYRQCWVTEAIALIAARTDTVAFHSYCHHRPVCYVEGRIIFRDEDHQEQDAAPFPNAFVYFGLNSRLFAEVFNRIGAVVAPYNGIT